MIVEPPPPLSGDNPAIPSSDTQAGTETPPVVDVATIIGGGREAVILHRGERYRLRLTANDKLILTK